MNLDDPKLTAYALGEITDPAEITEVETWLAANAEGRAYVADTQEMAAFLTEKLHTAAPVGLTEEQRAVILENDLASEKVIPFTDENPSRKVANRRPWSIVALTALAACLAAAPLLPWAELLRLRDSSAPTVAFNEKPMTLQMPQEEGKKESPRQEAAKKDIAAAKQLELALPMTAYKQNEEEPAAERRLMPKAQATPPPALAAVGGLLKTETDAAPSEPQSFAATLATTPMDQTAGNAVATDSMAQVATGTVTAAPASAPLLDAAGKDASFDQKAAAKKSRFGFDDGNGQTRTRAIRFDDGKDQTRSHLEPGNTESYDAITENDFLAARENPLSTFSTDVDTASYANVRRMLNDGQLPPKGAVRIEEMLNYFTYDYAPPTGDAPFSTNLEVATCPWQPDHRLVRIGLKGKEIPVADRKAANLVFLIDVSGSMDEPNKLPLLKQSLRLLVNQLAENDKVTLAVYAGSSGLVLPATANKQAIRDALDNLQPGGSTNGASGIKLAYEEAEKNFIKDGVNRVILATDGDFNVGVTNQSDLVDLITAKAKSGVFLSVLGFGTGNVKDSTMVKLADKGNGNYAYIDTLKEGKRVLVEQMGGTLITIAKDVKIQVEFNPAIVSNYRLIGYEKRALKKEDFADDSKDAGEIGSGHTVTALYEVVMVGSMSKEVHAEPLKYTQNSTNQVAVLPSGEMLTVKLRYKEPTGDVSKLLEFPLTDQGQKLDTASKDFQFASAVAEFGQLLRHSSHSQLASWESLIARASDAKGEDKGGYRAEFIELAKKAQQLTRRNDS